MPKRAGAKRCAGTALHTVLGLGWLALVYWLNPSFLWWLLPVAGALAVSIPISVLSSRVSLGRELRAERLFLIPEESYPPRVLRRMRRYLPSRAARCGIRRRGRRSAAQRDRVRGRRRAHAAFGCDARHVNDELVARALIDGPDALDDAEQIRAARRCARALAAAFRGMDRAPTRIRAGSSARRAANRRRTIIPPMSRGAPREAPRAAHRIGVRVRGVFAAAAFIGCCHRGESGERIALRLCRAQRPGARARRDSRMPRRRKRCRRRSRISDWDAFQSIRFRPERALWAGDALKFQLQFFHLGMQFQRAVRMHEVVDGVAREIAYDPAMFDLAQKRPRSQRRCRAISASPDFASRSRPISSAMSPRSSARAISARSAARCSTASRRAASRSIAACRAPRNFRISSRTGSSARAPTRRRSSCTRCSIRRASPAHIASRSRPASRWSCASMPRSIRASRSSASASRR